MARDREGRTYRVRQLPSHVDRVQAITLLAGLAEGIGPAENVEVLSLASSISPWETHPTKIATAIFKSLPPLFDNDEVEWVLPAQRIGLPQNIIVDVHFLDFTPLNEVEPGLHTLE
jgi:hypothetical protein